MLLMEPCSAVHESIYQGRGLASNAKCGNLFLYSGSCAWRQGLPQVAWMPLEFQRNNGKEALWLVLACHWLKLTPNPRYWCQT